MAQEQATMSLPMDLIKPAIEAKISATIMEALGSQDAVISMIVEQIMRHKVNEKGEVSSYSSENKIPWLTWAVQDATRTAIKDAIKANIGVNQDKIAAAISAEMGRSKSPLVRSMVAAMADGLVKACAENYRVSVNFFDKDR